MKTISPVLFFLVLLGGLCLTFRRNPTGRTSIYDERGRLVGYARKNSISDRTDYYDSEGKLKGYIRYNNLIDTDEYHSIDDSGFLEGLR
jgi:hypothetical protein